MESIPSPWANEVRGFADPKVECRVGVEWLALAMLMPRLWAVPGATTLERAGDEAEYDGRLTASEATYARCVCKKRLILIFISYVPS